jgi:tripartite-type tricarboxylate transporter receptor subunit TctC
MHPRRFGALVSAALFPRGAFHPGALYSSALVAVALVVAPVRAEQPYPTGPITLVVPFSAGGPTDVVGRLIAQVMSSALKQQVVIENIGGSGGVLGAARVAKAAPDGYTLLLHNIGFATSVALYRKLPFDPRRDFEPIGLVNDVPMTFVARKDLPVSTLAELIDYVKRNKDKVAYANAGIGGASHLCGMLFMSAIATQVTTVPYKGTGPAMNDLLGGQVDFLCDQTTNTTSQIKAGKIKVFAVTARHRVPALAEVPTMAEAGLPGFELGVWHALFAPKGTPQSVIETLEKALQQALQDPKVLERFAVLGASAAPRDQVTPEALRRHLEAEIARLTPIIAAAGVYAD